MNTVGRPSARVTQCYTAEASTSIYHGMLQSVRATRGLATHSTHAHQYCMLIPGAYDVTSKIPGCVTDGIRRPNNVKGRAQIWTIRLEGLCGKIRSRNRNIYMGIRVHVSKRDRDGGTLMGGNDHVSKTDRDRQIKGEGTGTDMWV